MPQPVTPRPRSSVEERAVWDMVTRVSEDARLSLLGSVGSAAAATVPAPQALGAGGPLPPRKITRDLSRLEDQAARALPPDSLAYILAGAGDNATARANAEAFRQWRIKRRTPRRRAARELSTTVLETRMPAPVLFAPVGVQKLAHPDGELASARAAATLKLTYINSTQGAYSMEEVAAANGAGSRWYQLYWPIDDELTVSFLRRARAAGYTHLMITLDTTLLGWRPLDLDRGYSPFLKNLGIANYTSDPVFRRRLRVPADEDPVAAGVAFASLFQNPGLSWKQLPLIRRNWDGPILLKGIQAVQDAKLAVEHRIDGIVVSNHGGRQVDGAIGSLDALPTIVDAVGGRLAVLFDSGIRTGADAFKALALGADAVLIGRPYLYGLALGGQAGVTHVMRTLLADLDRTIADAGYRSHRELSPASLTPVG
jgi:lactate 2-monooxygenase